MRGMKDVSKGKMLALIISQLNLVLSMVEDLIDLKQIDADNFKRKI